MKQFGIAILIILVSLPLFAGETKSMYRNGILIYYDGTTTETVDAVAPIKLFQDFNVAGLYIDAIDGSRIQGWSFNAVNSGTHATSTADYGILSATTGAADDDDLEISSGITFLPSKFPVVEARIAISGAVSETTSPTALVFGFSDAQTEAADYLAAVANNNVVGASATDCALFVRDYDQTGAYVNTVCARAGTAVTSTETNTLTKDSYNIYRVEVDSSGNCVFSIDGTIVQTHNAAITTTTPLCVYLGYINRGGGVHGVKVDYIRAWQVR